MVEQITVGARRIGGEEPVFVIAEAGSNHNGSYEQAIRLIDVAAEAGVDAVKFQTFTASRMYPRTAGLSDYLNDSRSIYDIIEQMEMPDDWIPRLAAHCQQRSIEFLSTPFDEVSADLLAPHVGVFKLASYELTHTPLVRHVARLGKPMIVSTGTAELSEVLEAVATIREEGNEAIILCQCTAAYPAPPDQLNLRAMVTLRDATGCLVGLSDHSRDPVLAPVLATALGASVLEKHVTLDNRLPGPDHVFAIEPNELKSLVTRIRIAEQMLGHGRKEALPVEQELHAFARRSIFTTRNIRAGEMLNRESVAVLRCGKLGHGLAPSEYERVLGRVAVRNLPVDSLVRLCDLD